MNFRVWVKSKFADKMLAPIKDEIISLIQPNESLVDIGCGTGDLLSKSSSKISHGLGVDTDEKMIEYTNETSNERNLDNIEFTCTDARDLEPENYDIATSTLCLHELPENTGTPMKMFVHKGVRSCFLLSARPLLK